MTNFVRRYVASLLPRVVYSKPETRARLQRRGINILPVDFYSNIPSIQEIENSYEYTEDCPPYLDAGIFDHERLGGMLKALIPFSPEFSPPVEGDEQSCRSFFWNNSQFSFGDPMSYYCFIRLIQPEAIIEIGSGFSTLVALEAVQRNGHGSIQCIEPYPRPFLKNESRVTLHQMKAQDIQPEFLNDVLRDNDVLFVDSTHTVKTGSDCLHVYLRLLPKIRRDIYVHVHDVFLPFGMPKQWLLDRQIYWTEQYLVLAFLIDNPKTSLLFSSTYNSRWNEPLMQTLMGGKYPIGGSSVWFKYNGSSGREQLPPFENRVR